MVPCVVGSIAWNERVSAAARGQQSRRTGKQGEQALAGRLFGCEEAGTMRRDETLSPAKEGRSPGRPGNDKKQTVYCSALDIAKNTLISSSCSSNDLRTLPVVSLPVHHLLSTPTITTENSEHITFRRVTFNKPSQARPAKLRLLISLRLADHPIELPRLNSI